MKRLLLICITAIVLLTTGCRQTDSNADNGKTSADTTITAARLLLIERMPECVLVTIRNPWDTHGAPLHRYALVPADSTLPDNLPAGVSVVRTPLQRALVYSSVHTSVFKELGRFDAVAGVTDAQYFTDPDIVNALADGRIADCGSSTTPTVERVIALDADAVLLSPYQDGSYGQVAKLGVPIIECADYLEYTPLGRAEWVKFYGLLLGREPQADSLYAATTQRYEAIRQRADSARQRPTVLTETVVNGIWNVPGGQSYMACLLRDAGGDYLWADDGSTGSLSLDFSQVLDRAQQADIWLIKSFAINSYADLKAAYELNDQFQAFRNHTVYACNTNTSRLFERFPFHPDLLLADFFTIFHPELQAPDEGTTLFYHPLAP